MRPSLVLILGALVLAVAAFAAGWALRPVPPSPPGVAPSDAPVAAALDSLAAEQRRLRARFERITPPRWDEERALRRPVTPSYTLHLERARQFGVEPVTGETDLRRLRDAGRLVPLMDTDGYVVRVLEHSAPFVTPRTRELAGAIAAEFQDSLATYGLPPYRLTISSATRTADSQADLRAINRNATSGASTHEYGVSVDIVYTRFAPPAEPVAPPALRLPDALGTRFGRAHDDLAGLLAPAYADHLFGLLVRILDRRQRAGEVLVLLEAEQPVFHLTTARR